MISIRLSCSAKSAMTSDNSWYKRIFLCLPKVKAAIMPGIGQFNLRQHIEQTGGGLEEVVEERRKDARFNASAASWRWRSYVGSIFFFFLSLLR